MVYTTTIVVLFFFGVLDPCSSVPAGVACKGEVVAVDLNFVAIFKSLPVFLLAYCCSPTIFNLVCAPFLAAREGLPRIATFP